MSDTLLELHTKKYTKDYIKREYALLRAKSELVHVMDPGMYSTFGDKKKYGGLVPTGIFTIILYEKRIIFI